MANNESEIARRLRNLSGRIAKDPISPGTSSGVRPDGTVNVNIPGRGPVRARAGNSCDAGECTLFEPENGEPIALGRSNSRVERENVARNVAGRNQENKKEPPATAICGLVYYVKHFDGFNQYAVQEVLESEQCSSTGPAIWAYSAECYDLGLTPDRRTGYCPIGGADPGNCRTTYDGLETHYVQVWLSEGNSMPTIPPYESQISLETGRNGTINISTSNSNSFLGIGHPDMPPSSISMIDSHLFLGDNNSRISIPLIWHFLTPQERAMVNEHHGVEQWVQYNPLTDQEEPIDPPFEDSSAYGPLSPKHYFSVIQNDSSLDISYQHSLQAVDPEGENPEQYEDKLQIEKATKVSIFIKNATMSSAWYEHRISVVLRGRWIRSGEFVPLSGVTDPLRQNVTITNIFDGVNIGNTLPTKAFRTPNIYLNSRTVNIGEEPGLLPAGTDYQVVIAYFYETVTSQTLTISEATYDIYIHTNIGATKITTINLPENLLVEIDEGYANDTNLVKTEYDDKIEIDYQILKLDKNEGPIALIAIKHHHRSRGDVELHGFEEIDIYKVSYTESNGLNSVKVGSSEIEFYLEWFFIKDMQGTTEEDLEVFELNASKCLVNFSTNDYDYFPSRDSKYNFINTGFTLKEVIEILTNEIEVESLLYASSDMSQELFFLEIKVEKEKVEEEEEYSLCELSSEQHQFSVFLPGIGLDYEEINSSVNIEAKVVGCGGVRLS